MYKGESILFWLSWGIKSSNWGEKMRHIFVILACCLYACSHEPAPPTAEAWHFSEPEQSILSQIDAEIFSLEDGVFGPSSQRLWRDAPKLPTQNGVQHTFYLLPMSEWAKTEVGSDLSADPASWYVLLPKEFFGTPKDLAFQLPPANTDRDWGGMWAIYLGNWERGWGHVSIQATVSLRYELQFTAERAIENPLACYQLSLFNATTQVQLPHMCGEPGDGFDEYYSFIYRRSE
jgi:hypothetical protein